MGTKQDYVIKQIATYWSHDSLSWFRIWTCLVKLFLSYLRNNPTLTNIWTVLSLTVYAIQTHWQIVELHDLRPQWEKKNNNIVKIGNISSSTNHNDDVFFEFWQEAGLKRIHQIDFHHHVGILFKFHFCLQSTWK